MLARISLTPSVMTVRRGIGAGSFLLMLLPHPSLRANGSRECAPDDRLRDEAIHSFFARRDGLLRFARNDGVASFRGGSQSRARNLEIPWDHPGMTTTRFVEVVPKRSPVLTIFWHCGFGHFSSRTGFGAR